MVIFDKPLKHPIPVIAGAARQSIIASPAIGATLPRASALRLRPEADSAPRWDRLPHARTRVRSPLLLAALAVGLLAACSDQAIKRKDGTTAAKPWSVAGLAKSDIDDVVELHQRETIASLRLLTEKLYRRNPAELGKGGSPDLQAAIGRIFDPVNHWHLSPQRQLDWTASINNAFRPDFAGDRVRSLMAGALAMIMSSYSHKTEVYLLDSLDPQKLYNAARNVEIVAWRLSNSKNARGETLLLTNAVDPNGVQNLSFEREYGKLIATQDLIARVVEDRTNRTIRFGVFNAASLVFLPI